MVRTSRTTPGTYGGRAMDDVVTQLLAWDDPCIRL